MAKGVAFRTNILPGLIETDLKQKKLPEINQKIRTRSATKIQALAKGVNFRTNVLPNLIETELKEKKIPEINNKIRTRSATKIQALAKGVNFRTNVLPNLIETDLKEQKLKERNNNNTTNAINVLTDAIKYKRARKALDVELKKNQKKIYETLKDKFKPTEALAYNPVRINTNEFKEQNRKKFMKQELNQKIEIAGRKRFAAQQLTQYPL